MKALELFNREIEKNQKTVEMLFTINQKKTAKPIKAEAITVKSLASTKRIEREGIKVKI